MTYSMASLLKKTIRGKTYYYARECRRVDGKPKIVWQKYLGRADDIITALTQPTAPATTPERAVITEFVAALNRCTDPRSKAQIAAWFERSALRRLLDFRPEQLTSQRFWDQMDRLS